MTKEKTQSKRKHASEDWPMYEANEVTRTKEANRAVMLVAKMLRPLWEDLLCCGWKKWQVEKIMQDAVQNEVVYFSWMWDRASDGARPISSRSADTGLLPDDVGKGT